MARLSARNEARPVSAITANKGAKRFGIADAWRLATAALLAFACTWALLLASSSQAYADELGDSFIVAAAGQDGAYLLEPVNVPYSGTDSVKDALEQSDVGVTVSADGTVESVAGVECESGVYLYYFTDYEGRDSALLGNVEARSIKALFISSADVGEVGQSHVDVLERIREYLLRPDGLHNYDAATAAYDRCLAGLPSATGTQAATLASDFATAIAAYDAIMNGEKRSITFRVARGGSAYNNAQVSMTDKFGNITQAVRTGSGTYVARVVDTDYSYEVMSADGLDGVRLGDENDKTPMHVTGNATIEADIPAEEWYDSIELRVTSAGDMTCSNNGTSAAGRKEQALLSTVPDAVSPIADLAVYAKPAAAISSQTDAYPLYVVYDGVNGESLPPYQIAYKSSSFKPPYLVDSNAQGASFTYEVRHHVDPLLDAYQVEICPAQIERSPTLSGLSVKEGITQLVKDFGPYKNQLDVYTIAGELSFAPQPHGSAQEGYAATVNGATASAKAPVAVDVSAATLDAPVVVKVVVSLEGKASNTYTVNVYKAEPVTATLSHATGVSVHVFNDAGGEIEASSQTSTSAQFKLIKDRDYTYVATKGEYYHATCDFTVAGSQTVAVATPSTTDVVNSFALAQGNNWGTSPQFELDEAKSTLHEQYFIVPDYWSSQSWLRAYPKSATDASSYTYRATHTRQDTGVLVKSSASSFVPSTSSGELRITGGLPGFTTVSGFANTATFTVTTATDAATGVVFTQDYHITALRELTLANMSLSDGLNECALRQAETADDDNPTLGFDRDVRGYVAVVAEGTSEVRVSVTFSKPVSASSLASGGYTVSAGGQQVSYEAGATKVLNVALKPTVGDQTVDVTVSHVDPLTPDAVYRITVRVMPKVSATFVTTPSDAAVTVIDSLTGLRVSRGGDGTFTLISGYDYSYTVAARGYIGKRDSFTAEPDFTATVVLEPVPDNPTIDPSIASSWPYFRADANNNGVVSVKTPIPTDDESESALLYWAQKLGEGYSSGAAGCPILVDGYLYTYGGDKIYKMDTVTGKTVATSTMVGTSSFAITPMTYAEGMVFVALSNGRVEAFNAATLESLWVYQSPHGGQPNCPIAYHDGCIYTGFWNWANVCDFVCLSIADEDPTTPGSGVVDDPVHPGQTITAVLDAKVAIWELPHAGGFYWAGAWAGDDYVIVGSDNAAISEGMGTSLEGEASGVLFSIDPYTGKVIDELSDYPGGVNVGNIRSTVTYDEQTDRFYYCGRGGYLCSVAVNADGTFDRAGVKAIRLKNNANDGVVSATSTPVIYNGRAYVGADHGGSYNAYYGQSVDVVDLATGTVAYYINMQGRPQTSALATTGYVEKDGYVYVYFFDNYTPGKLRCFKDKPGQTHAVETGSETYTSGGSSTTFDDMASVVFCPQAGQAQYCICSPIVDEYGTIYFKNDSAYMMAVGTPIEKLEVTELPTVTTYGVGETFDPAGMKVVATYANGAKRDVTDYVQCSTEVFAEQGTVNVPIVFPYTMYQSTSSTQEIGEAPDYNYPKPSTTVEVEVLASMPPQITTTELPHAVATDYATGKQVPYEVKLTATGAPRKFTWTLAGALPAGLTFKVDADTATATISGAPETGTGGAYPIAVSVSNRVGSPATADFTLEVYERPRVTAPGKTLRVTPGKPFSYQVQASGYPQPLTYVLREGSQLPAGLSLGAQTGVISGTTNESGTYRVRVYATNVSQEVGIGVPVSISLKVTGAPEVVTSSLPDGVVGQAYEAALEADSDFDVTWSWQAADGSQLPPGLTLDPVAGDSKKAVITGACGQRGVYAIDVSATNSLGTTTERFKLTVKQSMADVKIDPIADQVYTGGALTPKVSVSLADAQATAVSDAAGGLVGASLTTALTEGVDYEVTYRDNVNVGTATAVVEGKGLFQGLAERAFTITKAKQPLSAKASKSKFTVKYAKLKKRKVTTSKPIKVQNAKGTLTYAKVKVNKKKFAKKFTVNKKTGQITVAKKVKRGTYKVTVKVKASGDANYKSGSKNVVVKVVVR